MAVTTRQARPGRPTRPTGWPVLRTPRWMLAGGALLLTLIVLAAIPHHPSAAERATDLRSLATELTTDVRSCAGGLTDSLIALNAIRAGTSHDLATAEGIATKAADNCSPANSMETEALVQVQVPESLASFHLDQAVTYLTKWASVDAVNVCADIAAVLAADTPAARTRLAADQRVLDSERASFSQLMSSAARRLAAHIAMPSLPD